MAEMERIGVVGAGLMGAEIAFVFALAGHSVLLNDTTEEQLAAAKSRLADIVEKGIQRRFFPHYRTVGVLDRIVTTTNLDDFKDCDLVFEAVFESEELKAGIYGKLDKVSKPECIFCSNTSTIAISNLASTVAPERRPRFIGTHFFSPVSRMRLVEVIPAFETSDETYNTAVRICRGADKVTVKVKDVAGFAVNRLLLIMQNEAVRLVEEGVASPEDIDIACRLGLGHPMGPFELMDAVSSGLCLQVMEILQDAYGERFHPPLLLKQRVKAGYLGRRVGKGWREH